MNLIENPNERYLCLLCLLDWETEDETDDEEGEEEDEDGSSEEDSGEETEDYEYEEEEDEDLATCPICLDKLRDQDVGTPEACDHNFCLECIQEWAKVSN